MKPREIRIIGVPLDLGAGRRGVDMGPSAIRVTGLNEKLLQLGHRVIDSGDVDVTTPETSAIGDPSLRFVDAILPVSEKVADDVYHAFSQGQTPIVLGGDHSIAIGTLAGAARFFLARKQGFGVVWVDAHGDMNTPVTTPSGNVHGMALAIGLGLGDQRLVNLCGFAGKVDAKRVALVGVRDLDPGEGEQLRAQRIVVLSMREIDDRGMSSVMREAIEVASTDTAGIYVQFDMDALDPSHAPGTGTPVPGGLTYREAHLAMEMLGDTDRVIALDMVETNPALDARNRTAELATGLILSLFGKRIFPDS